MEIPVMFSPGENGKHFEELHLLPDGTVRASVPTSQGVYMMIMPKRYFDGLVANLDRGKTVITKLNTEVQESWGGHWR